MDIEIPNWLNDDFIKSALEGNEKMSRVTIANLEIRRAVPKGNNYMCDLFRVNVHYYKTCKNVERINDNKDIEIIGSSLIVKCPITGGLCEFIGKFGMLQKEVLIYQEFSPKLGEILINGDNLMAKPFQSSKENVIVLEDLNFQGYKMANRLELLDYEHCMIALESLALFHAASVKIFEENPELVKRNGVEAFFHKDDRVENEFLVLCQINLAIIELSNWPKLDDYMKTIKSLPDKMWDLLTDCFDCTSFEFNVLNHGDFWVTNMLFKYDHNNKPIKVKFIDLQVTRYTTPAIDLIYFMQGSVQEEVRLNKYDDLLKIYLKSLNDNLERFKCKTPKLQESQLRNALKRCQFYEFYTNITLVPVVIHDSEKVFEIKELTEKDITDVANNPFRKYLQTERYRELFTKRIVDEFSKHEWFTDINKNSCEAKNKNII